MPCYRQWKWVWNQQCHVSSVTFLIPVWMVLLSIFTGVNGRLLWFPTALKTKVNTEFLHLLSVQKRWQSKKKESPQPFYNSCSQLPIIFIQASTHSHLWAAQFIHTSSSESCCQTVSSEHSSSSQEKAKEHTFTFLTHLFPAGAVNQICDTEITFFNLEDTVYVYPRLRRRGGVAA